MTTLTKKVLVCREKGEGYSQLVQDLSLIAYRYPERSRGWSEDECSDFFCVFFGRIPGMIERFEYTGTSFDTFFYTAVRWQMKSFKRKQNKAAAYERAVSAPPFWSVRETPEPYLPENKGQIPQPLRREFDLDETGVIRDRASCIRVLCITLRNCEFISEALVCQVSSLCGCTALWLSACLIHLRERMEKRRAAFNRLQLQRNGIFLKICLLHDQLNTDLDRLWSSRLMKQIEIEKHNLRMITDRINTYPLHPTHQEISQVLGLPKGTVDSGLYCLKNVMQRLL